MISARMQMEIWSSVTADSGVFPRFFFLHDIGGRIGNCKIIRLCIRMYI